MAVKMYSNATNRLGEKYAVTNSKIYNTKNENAYLETRKVQKKNFANQLSASSIFRN